MSEVLERCRTPRGELVLRRSGDALEIISNGVFLMSTAGGESERLLARAALGACARPSSVAVAGLGVGTTLAEALADSAVRRVTVVEVEPAIVRWCREALAPHAGYALDDPRVRVEVADVADWTARADERFDAVCVDVDNGPDWTVTEANAALYGDAGIARLAALLAPDGALAIWSAADAPALTARLRARFARVETLEVPVERGEPDRVIVAAGSR